MDVLLNVALLWRLVKDHELLLSFDCCRFRFDSTLLSLQLSALVVLFGVANECKREP